MNLSTAVVLAIVIVAIALAIFKAYKDKKAGINLSCGVKCSECSGHCHDEEVERRRAEWKAMKEKEAAEWKAIIEKEAAAKSGK